ncbi:outer membrane receptor protein involved in Fe transport [Tahibacter aquaticus]|uniref:Outer membrane receptor protein involved in Fe transport n=1 Tax=Tahibacter aquaticus TaxID=520092 RepID=A0A4R6YWV8_9GAMM|nr:TonB-dependent receptor [Tahibacter aquaticus]TDR43323.1 outer membrane receptor protein involved in Fe transport [Tahibacter aquaticus]
MKIDAKGRLAWVAAVVILAWLGQGPVFASGFPATQLPPNHVYGMIGPDQLAQADAASAGVVTQEQIENRPISRPAEVLEVVPGLIATQHSGDGKANQYFLRGFNLDHGTDLAAFVDGVPNNLRTHAHGQGYNDLNGLIPELIDTIEYRKGPYYAEDGDFASAGSVRIRYADRLPQPVYQLGVGSDGYVRALLAGSHELSAGRGVMFGLDAGKYDGAWEKPEDTRRISMIGKWRGGDEAQGYHAEFSAYRNRWQSSDQIPLRAVASAAVGRYGQIDPDLGGDTSRYTLAGEYHGALGSGQLLVNAYYTRYSLDLFSNFTYFLDDPVAGDQFEQADERDYYGATAKYVQAWTSGAITQALAVGLDARIDDIGTVGLFHTRARQRLGTTRLDRVNEQSLGLFASYETQWTPWLRSVAGLRWDAYRTDVNSNIVENSGSASDRRASPKLSLILGPWAGTQVFLNAGRGFHSNDARGATLRVDPTGTGEAAFAQNLLVPSTGTEIGLRTTPTPNLTLSAALWQLKIGSELVFSGDGGTTEPSFPSQRHGLELSMYWQARPWLAIDADYARSMARFDGNPAGSRIANAIERVASVGVQAKGNGRWSGSLRYRYLGPAPLIEDGSVRSHSTTLLNGEIGYALTPAFRLSAEVLNLLDSKSNDISYFYASRLRGESEAVADIHFHPVEPRQLRFTLRGTF